MRNYAALIGFIEARAAMPLVWGSEANDCVSYGASAVEAQTGVNPITATGHRWTTRTGAMRILRKVGGVTGAADSVFQRVPLALASRGDIGLVTIEGRESLVVIEGDTVVGPGLTGQVRLPRTACVLAWRAA